MYWQEDDDTPEITLPDAVVDVLFALECRAIPVDHCHALSAALLRAAPWLADTGCGIHSIHVAGSQNGWERPSHGGDQALLLSRRTKLAIRVPRERVDALKAALEGERFDVGGAALRVGSGKPKPLGKEGTLFARYVAGPADLDEEAFLRWAADELAALDIRMRKALCGKATPLATPAQPIMTRSLMVASLSAEESVRLQERGLGPHRVMGCGLFIPHKGIDAVQKSS
jgi:CRISPR-associated protein Cas6